jgi:hypothetical protein
VSPAVVHFGGYLDMGQLEIEAYNPSCEAVFFREAIQGCLNHESHHRCVSKNDQLPIGVVK